MRKFLINPKTLFSAVVGTAMELTNDCIAKEIGLASHSTITNYRWLAISMLLGENYTLKDIEVSGVRKKLKKRIENLDFSTISDENKSKFIKHLNSLDIIFLGINEVNEEAITIFYQIMQMIHKRRGYRRVKPWDPRKKIAVITTGGTIAGVSECYNPGYSVKLNGKQVLAKFPELNDIANIDLHDIGIIDSVNVTPNDWIKISEEILKCLKDKTIDGIVVTHGTDTMAYSLMAIPLMVQKINKPVVFTGAMAPTDRNEESYNHCRRHMYDSVIAASNSNIFEMVLCFSGDKNSTYTNLYRASSLKYKQSSNKFNSFKGVEPPIAEIKDQRIKYLNPYNSSKKRPVKIQNKKFDNSVTVLYRRPIQTLEVGIYSRVTAGYKAIIIVGFEDGLLGRTEPPVMPVVDAIKKGTIVCVISDAGFATLSKHKVSEMLEEEGAIPLGDMVSQRALIKLMWVLPQAKGDLAKIKAMMQHNYVGEIHFP